MIFIIKCNIWQNNLARSSNLWWNILLWDANACCSRIKSIVNNDRDYREDISKRTKQRDETVFSIPYGTISFQSFDADPQDQKIHGQRRMVASMSRFEWKGDQQMRWDVALIVLPSLLICKLHIVTELHRVLTWPNVPAAPEWIGCLRPNSEDKHNMLGTNFPPFTNWVPQLRHHMVVFQGGVDSLSA